MKDTSDTGRKRTIQPSGECKSYVFIIVCANCYFQILNARLEGKSSAASRKKPYINTGRVCTNWTIPTHQVEFF